MHRALKTSTRPSRARALSSLAAIVATSVAFTACGEDDPEPAGASASGGSKLIVATMGFPCSLNDFAKSLCDGFNAAERELPEGFRLEIKTGTDFADVNGYNNLIQTSAQLDPGGLVVFPGGPATQTPVLNRACAEDIKLIVIDNPAEGLDEGCQSGYVAANHRQLGEDVGKWLVENPPASKQVGIVTLAPGQVSSNDDRVEGFTDVVEAAGFKVADTVVTDLSLDKTRTQVTNMLTANPELGAVFSANDQMGYGTAEAVKASKNTGIKQLTVDGALDALKRVPEGLAATAAQDPFAVGRQSVLNMAKLLQGEKIPKQEFAPSSIVDESNVEEYLAKTGKG